MAFGLSCVPFREELCILHHITAAKEDPVVSTVLNSLEAADVQDVGVEPLVGLTSNWFTTSVAPRVLSVASVALVPDQDAGVPPRLLTSLSFRKHCRK